MNKIFSFSKKMILFLVVMIGFAASSAMAQMEFGVRVGVSLDPDQFHFGAHVISEPLMENFTFRPNLEIGVGKDITLIAANFEFAYQIPVPKQQFSIYVGAGPALNIYRFGDSFPQNGDTDTGGGFNILFGVEHRNGLMGELKVGAIDSPEVKFTIGYTFR
jgi:hypothetical protein